MSGRTPGSSNSSNDFIIKSLDTTPDSFIALTERGDVILCASGSSSFQSRSDRCVDTLGMSKGATNNHLRERERSRLSRAQIHAGNSSASQLSYCQSAFSDAKCCHLTLIHHHLPRGHIIDPASLPRLRCRPRKRTRTG